jgi:hypothetical protein
VTLQALEPAWGFLRVFDAATGVQVGKFDEAPNVHTYPPPEGEWLVHNTEVRGARAYSSWYSNGIVALDLRPLTRTPPADPVMVGQFVAPTTEGGFLAGMWGVAIRPTDGVIFASDFTSGLWIVRPTGPAAP